MESLLFRSRALALRPAAPSRGFTLVEMLVVLAIISVITAIALFSQNDFNRSVVLTDTAYSVALSLREMQTFGLSSRQYNGIQNAGYGLYLSKASPNTYQLFADTYKPSSNPTIPSNCVVGPLSTPTPESKPGDCLYTSGSDGIVQNYAFSRGFQVTKFCGYDTSATPVKRCSTDATGGIDALSVVFLRSTTESIVEGLQGSSWIPLTSAEIYITSSDATGTRGICVSRIGQVSVTTGTCP